MEIGKFYTVIADRYSYYGQLSSYNESQITLKGAIYYLPGGDKVPTDIITIMILKIESYYVND